jgi:hypothetical protein
MTEMGSQHAVRLAPLLSRTTLPRHGLALHLLLLPGRRTESCGPLTTGTYEFLCTWRFWSESTLHVWFGEWPRF